MIYITGDCHGDFERFSELLFPEQKDMTKDDYMIICGDFGGVWEQDGESEIERMQLDWLEQRPFTTLFVCGNHENFDRLYRYPEVFWKGGRVHKIRPSVLHLMRGQVFVLEEKKIFVFGGARSGDIADGILEMDDSDFERKRVEWRAEGKRFRINHFNWWAQELPTIEEMEEGRIHLAANDYQVDYVVTHCRALHSEEVGKTDCLNEYFDDLRRRIRFNKWYFGHYHGDKNVNEREVLLYHRIIPLGDIV